MKLIFIYLQIFYNLFKNNGFLKVFAVHASPLPPFPIYITSVSSVKSALLPKLSPVGRFTAITKLRPSMIIVPSLALNSKWRNIIRLQYFLYIIFYISRFAWNSRAEKSIYLNKKIVYKIAWNGRSRKQRDERIFKINFVKNCIKTKEKIYC